MQNCWIAVVLSCLSSSVLAQATLDVPSVYADIDSALAVAQPGDLVVVQPGTYPAFTMNVGVTIVAPTGAVIANNEPCSHCWSYTVINPPLGQLAHVHGLTFRSLSAVRPHIVSVVSGHVTFGDCSFLGGHPAKVHEALTVGGGDVFFEGCTVSGPHDGLVVTGGHVVASRSTFVASMSTSTLEPHAIQIAGGRVELNQCNVVGADAYPLGMGWPAIHAYGSSRLSLTDTTVAGGDSVSSYPVPAVLNESTIAVRHCRSTMTGGLGFVIPGQAGWQVPGPPVSGLESAARLLASYGLVEFVDYGAPEVGSGYRVMTQSLPGSLIVVATGDLMMASSVPFALEPLRLNPATIAVVSAGVADGNGLFLTPSTGPIPAQLFGASIWLQPAMFELGAVGLGAPVGGVVH